MKTPRIIASVILGAALLGTAGCSKSGDVDTAKVESAFQSAPASDKTDVDKAISAIKAGDYAGALTSLQKASANLKLTPEQKSALQELVNQVQAKLGDAAKKAAEGVKEGADKAASDLQKAVGK